ncbi:MAG: glutathione-disulfide reductase, partial [Alphaproteobacteria bacterium]
MYDYDFFVMGAGSGGVRACRIAAAHGARVAVAEDRYLGGTCVNVGCVPKKLLVYASHFADDFEDAEGFGWTVGESKFSWSKLIANKNAEISRLNGIYQTMLEGSGVKIINGTVKLEDAHTVTVGDDRYTAEYILVAVGGWPVVPDIPGKELAITSNDAFFLHDLPERVLLVGGGYISVEFAGIFHGLGSQVTQLYRGTLFLRGFDDDLRAFLAGEMRKKKIDLRFDTNITALAKTDGGIAATLTDGSILEADVVMYATGRAPMTANIGLEAVGIELNAKGAVVVDEYSKTSVDNIYAVGDVTDRINLTPVAIREGHAVSDTLFGNKPSKADHVDVPSAVFSQPPIGSVGLTEAEARK